MVREKAGDRVYRYIENKILNKEWKPGDKIDTEIELADNLNVSRVSVREAIQKLVTLKILLKKVGTKGGTFVNYPSPDDYLENLLPILILGDYDYNEIMIIRKALEPISVENFIKNAKEEHVKKLEEIHRKMVNLTDSPDEFLKYDILFHKIIARGSGNTLLDKILEMLLNINEHYGNSQYSNFSFEQNIEDHQNILDAIKKRETFSAIDGVKKHISRKISNN